MSGRKLIQVNEDAMKEAIANAKDVTNRGLALAKITEEYVTKTGKKVCTMWVRKRLVDLNLLGTLARSKRGRKSK